MKNSINSLILFTCLLQTSFAQDSKSIDQYLKVIYGEDNRSEVSDYHDAAFRDLSQSVAGMVRSNALIKDPRQPGRVIFPRRTAQNFLNLCPEEPFSQQITLPICSGFLVGEDLLVTAGHCVEDESDCQRYKWVFGYDSEAKSLAQKDIYGCKEILDTQVHDSRFKLLDYAVIKLDRKVEDREPLKYRKDSKAKINTPLVVIGHPLGLPMKISDSAKVSRMNLEEIKKPVSSLLKKRYYFLANLDSYSGNSGSPVFNQETREVEGILVEGAEDFVQDQERGCLLSSRLSNKRWKVQEKVFRITKIPLLQAK